MPGMGESWAWDQSRNRDKGATLRQTCNHYFACPFPKLLRNVVILHSVLFESFGGSYLRLSDTVRGLVFTSVIHNTTLRVKQTAVAFIESGGWIVEMLHRVLSLIQHGFVSFQKTSGRTSATKLMNRSFRSQNPLGPQTLPMDIPCSPSLTIKGMHVCAFKIYIKKMYEFVWWGNQPHLYPFRPMQSKTETNWPSRPCIDLLAIYYHELVIDSTQYVKSSHYREHIAHIL